MKEKENDPFYKRLSHNITREGSTIPFCNDYVYKFKNPQFLEDVDNFDYFGIDHNDFKQKLVDLLVHEFRISLNSVVFGDPAGKEYLEFLEREKKNNPKEE